MTGGPVFARGDWRKLESGSLAWLQAVDFLDEEKGYAAGSGGTLLETKDAGLSWRRVSVPTSDTIRDLHFVDRSIAWMLCDRGRTLGEKNPTYLMRTADGGKTWSQIEFGQPSERYDRLFFAPDGTAFASGEGSKLARFDSGGEPLGQLTLPVRYLIADGIALSPSKLILAGGGGTLVDSGDHGRTWRAAIFLSERPAQKLNSIFFADPRFGWTAGNGGVIFSTNDGGETWRKQLSGTGSNIYDIAFRDQMNGFAVGEAGSILRTDDGGSGWSVDNSGTRHRLERVVFVGKRAFAVGYGGTIVSISLRGRTS